MRQVLEWQCLGMKQTNVTHFGPYRAGSLVGGNNVLRLCLSTSRLRYLQQIYSLEASKADDSGHAIHEGCYMLKLRLLN